MIPEDKDDLYYIIMGTMPQECRSSFLEIILCCPQENHLLCYTYALCIISFSYIAFNQYDYTERVDVGIAIATHVSSIYSKILAYIPHDQCACTREKQTCAHTPSILSVYISTPTHPKHTHRDTLCEVISITAGVFPLYVTTVSCSKLCAAVSHSNKLCQSFLSLSSFQSCTSS